MNHFEISCRFKNKIVRKIEKTAGSEDEWINTINMDMVAKWKQRTDLRGNVSGKQEGSIST